MSFRCDAIFVHLKFAIYWILITGYFSSTVNWMLQTLPVLEILGFLQLCFINSILPSGFKFKVKIFQQIKKKVKYLIQKLINILLTSPCESSELSSRAKKSHLTVFIVLLCKFVIISNSSGLLQVRNIF